MKKVKSLNNFNKFQTKKLKKITYKNKNNKI